MLEDFLTERVMMNSEMLATGRQGWSIIANSREWLTNFSRPLWEIRETRERALHGIGMGVLTHNRTYIQKYHHYLNSKPNSNYNSKRNKKWLSNKIENLIANWITSKIAKRRDILLFLYESELRHNRSLPDFSSIEPNISSCGDQKVEYELQE